jgi:hypothetical protein
VAALEARSGRLGRKDQCSTLARTAERASGRFGVDHTLAGLDLLKRGTVAEKVLLSHILGTP